MRHPLSPARGIVAIPVIILAVLLALVASWGMHSKASFRPDPDAQRGSLEAMSSLAEDSEARSAQQKTRIQIAGDSSTNLVEFRSQSKLSDTPNLSLVVPAGKQVAVRLTPDSYRIHVTPVDEQTSTPLQRDPRSVTFVEVTGTPSIIDISRLSTNRLPFPRAGAGS
jgi:hypothetical protein